MNPRTILLALAALTTAGVTAFLVNGWMERQRALNVKAPVVKVERLQVLVAKTTLGAGTFLKPTDTVWQAWPEGNLLPAYVVKGKRRKEDFVGSVVRSQIIAGQPVTDAGVVKVGERGFLAAVLSPGMRAVSFPINAATGISGLVFPGDRIDLILSHRLRSQSSRKIVSASETVLTNVRVIAMDSRTDDQKNKGKGSGVPKIVTLEVRPKQAEIISVALNLGKLSLSLRSLSSAKDGSAGDQEKDLKAARGRTVTVDGEVSRLLSIQHDSEGITIMRGTKSQSAAVTDSKEKEPEGPEKE